MERAVGWFLFLATALLLFGFGYYIYKTAESKGWFKNKAKYFIFVDSAKNLAPGTSVELLGKEVGHVTDVQPMPARVRAQNIMSTSNSRFSSRTMAMFGQKVRSSA